MSYYVKQFICTSTSSSSNCVHDGSQIFKRCSYHTAIVSSDLSQLIGVEVLSDSHGVTSDPPSTESLSGPNHTVLRLAISHRYNNLKHDDQILS